MAPTYEGIDKIYERLSHFSWYQFFILICGSWVCFTAGLVQTGSVFLQAEPEEYRCKNYVDTINGTSYESASFASTSCRVFDIDWAEQCPTANTASDFDDCAVQNELISNLTKCTKCDDYEYSPTNTFTETAFTEFNWVCDDDVIPMSSISTSIFMCGLFFGALGFGMLSDFIGRRNGMLVSAICTFIANLSLYWVNNMWAYTFIRLLCGAFAHGGVIVSYVYIMEFMGPNARAWVASQYLTVFSVGFMSLSLVGYYARDWHQMQVAIACIAIPVFAFHWILPTSNRWLYSKGRKIEARNALKSFSRKCKNELDDEYIDYVEAASSTTQAKAKGIDVFKYQKMKWLTVNQMYCWFVTSMVYYGLGLNAGSLSGNIFTNNLINGVFEIVARIVAPIGMESKLLGRRLSLVIMFFICGASCIISMLLKESSNCTPTISEDCFETSTIPENCNEQMFNASKYLAFVGKFAVAGTFSILYVYSAELYPTCIRASAVGICSSGARVGGALSPLIFGVDGTLPWFSNTVFGTLSFVAAISSFFLPETLGMPMSQTLDEAESYYYKTPEELRNNDSSGTKEKEEFSSL